MVFTIIPLKVQIILDLTVRTVLTPTSLESPTKMSPHHFLKWYFNLIINLIICPTFNLCVIVSNSNSSQFDAVGWHCRSDWMKLWFEQQQKKNRKSENRHMSAYCLITCDHCYGLEVVLYVPVTIQWQAAEPFNKHSDTELLITVCVCNKNDPCCLDIGENNHTTQNQQPTQHVILFLSFPVRNPCPQSHCTV